MSAGIKGFSPQNIWRMKQFYETYAENEKLSTMSREISWSKRSWRPLREPFLRKHLGVTIY